MSDAEPSTVRLAEPSSETLFDLVETIGEGGMGTVYRARDHATGAIVAIKLLKKDADAVRFAREVSALARLSHPNIVRYAGHGITGEGTQFVAMQWLEGESLEEALRGDRVPLRRALEIARDVARALAYAHEQGIVHRDLKPSNVFLSSEGTKILDFGVARFVGVTGFTHTGQVIGTPSYMAPEQARGERGIGPSADLFSLGCILYRCVARESPFAAPDMLAVLNKLATHTPPRLRGVPRGLADLVSRLLAKEASGRPASAREVEQALDALLATDLQADPTPVVAEPTLESHHAPSRPRARIAGILAISAAAASAAMYFAFARSHAKQANAAPADVRVIAQRACRTWAAEMARRQLPDGSFTGESHRDPTGWDTGQELAGLEQAKSCATISSLTTRAAADALVKMRRLDGWSGPDRVSPTVSNAGDAWAALGLALAARDEPAVRDAALAARALLASKQSPDGSFGYEGPASEGSEYTTMLAAWALASGATIDGGESARKSERSALDWLRRRFEQSSDLRRVAGFEEQYVWLVAKLRRDEADPHVDDEVLRTGAADIVARCALDRASHACTRPMYEDGTVRIGAGKLVTLWHAWVGAAADGILSSGVTVAADVRADLEAVTRWDATTIDKSMDALAALPEYQLSEYLVAASTVASAR